MESLQRLRPGPAGEVVSLDRLIDYLWGDDPPATTVNNRCSPMSRRCARCCREVGGRSTTLPCCWVRQGTGYVVRALADAVNVAAFRRLVAEGLAAAARGQPALAAGAN